MKKKQGRVFWLVYIDLSISKSRGRLIPRGQAVNRPTIQEVSKALERLGYKFQVFPDKKYPALWFDDKLYGYFVVDTREKIRDVALKVAQEVRRLRA